MGQCFGTFVKVFRSYLQKLQDCLGVKGQSQSIKVLVLVVVELPNDVVPSQIGDPGGRNDKKNLHRVG